MNGCKVIALAPLLTRKFSALASAICFSTAAILSLAVASHAQTTADQTPSVVDAARNARERTMDSGNHAKIITDSDLGVQSPAANDDLRFSSMNANEVPNSLRAGCDNPRAERLTAELQAAQQELDQVRRDLQYNPPVVSGNNLDLQYFKPGNSGFNVGAPPLLDAQPPVPARVTQVELEERVDRLQKALRLACAPPEAARMQNTIDDDEQELNILQRQFALDQDDYYSRPVTERIGGNPQLDGQQQQIQALQAEIQDLREQLALLMSAQGPG
jgi:hypothetical protein